MMKKGIALLLILVMTLGLFGGCGAVVTPVEDFDYEIVNGEVIITGYHGTDREIYIPAKIEERPVTQIDSGAFTGYDLTLVSIPSSVEVVSAGAFEKCVCLEKVTFSEGLKVIESFAFYECDALVTVELPDGLTLLDGFAFGDCDTLEEVILPDDFEGFEILSFINSSRRCIDNPIDGSDNAVLVVKKNSKAVSLIETYGEGTIPYRER